MIGYTNRQQRRALRKFVEHYGPINTRHLTETFGRAYKTSKQRVAGNLRSLKYDDKTVQITTYIPKTYSEMSA